MSRFEDEQMWRWADVKMSRCEDEQMWRWADVKMSRCEDEQMWRCWDVKMWRWEDVKMRRCEDEKMWRWEDAKMRRCEDEKMFCRPPLLEEPCTQTLSGKREKKGKKEKRGKKEKKMEKTEKHDLKKHFLNWKPNVLPLARDPKEKKKKKNNVTVMQFLPNPPLCNVPRNHDVVICSDIFSYVHGSCCCHMFMVHVAFTCLLFMLNGLERFCRFFPRGFYPITATQFMFGIWWPPMFTNFYHSLCVLLFYCFHLWFISFPGAF